MQNLIKLVLLAITLCMALVCVAQPHPEFKTLNAGFVVNGMSGDGNTLVGQVNGQPAAWSTTTGLGMLPTSSPNTSGEAYDASRI